MNYRPFPRHFARVSAELRRPARSRVSNLPEQSERRQAVVILLLSNAPIQACLAVPVASSAHVAGFLLCLRDACRRRVQPGQALPERPEGVRWCTPHGGELADESCHFGVPVARPPICTVGAATLASCAGHPSTARRDVCEHSLMPLVGSAIVAGPQPARSPRPRRPTGCDRLRRLGLFTPDGLRSHACRGSSGLAAAPGQVVGHLSLIHISEPT